MNLQENISRIKKLMNLRESQIIYNLDMIEQYDEEMFSNKETDELESDDDSKKFKKSSDFSKSVIQDIVWRAGQIKFNPLGGGIWFGDSKKGVEDFALSVRREKREGKPYHINMQNPFYFDSFWRGYVPAVDKLDGTGRRNLMHDLIEDGYDGIIIGEDTWNDTGDEFSVTGKQYIVFDENDVKPA